MKASPYLRYPEDRELVNRLVQIKEAAAAMDCADTTLRNNAKMGRLPAYQRRHGTPVYVLFEEVEEFLQRRPDIRSKFHPDPESNDRTSYVSAPAPVALPPGAGLPLQCLDGASPEIIKLVSRCLIEIAETLLSQPVREDEPDMIVP